MTQEIILGLAKEIASLAVSIPACPQEGAPEWEIVIWMSKADNALDTIYTKAIDIADKLIAKDKVENEKREPVATSG